METTFTETVSRWHDFYSLAGAASATLIGLLFVGVSIHIDLIASENAKTLRLIAGQILFNFIYVIVMALTVVSPIVSREFLMVVVLTVGATGFLRMIFRAVNIIRSERNWFQEEIRNPVNSIAHILLPVSCFLVILASGLILLFSPDQLQVVLALMMVATAYLIVRAIVDAWNLLIQVAIVKRTRTNVFSAQETQPNTPV